MPIDVNIPDIVYPTEDRQTTNLADIIVNQKEAYGIQGPYVRGAEAQLASLVADDTKPKQVEISTEGQIQSNAFEQATKQLYSNAKTQISKNTDAALVDAMSPSNLRRTAEITKQASEDTIRNIDIAEDADSKLANSYKYPFFVSDLIGLFDSDYNKAYQINRYNAAMGNVNRAAQKANIQTQQQANDIMLANGLNPITKGWTDEVDQWAQQYSTQLANMKQANASAAAHVNDAYKAQTDRMEVLRKAIAQGQERSKLALATQQANIANNTELSKMESANLRKERDVQMQLLTKAQGDFGQMEATKRQTMASQDNLRSFMADMYKADKNYQAAMLGAMNNIRTTTASNKRAEADVEVAKIGYEKQLKANEGKAIEASSKGQTGTKTTGAMLANITEANAMIPTVSTASGGSIMSNPVVQTAVQGLQAVNDALAHNGMTYSSELDDWLPNGTPMSAEQKALLISQGNAYADTIKNSLADYSKSAATQELGKVREQQVKQRGHLLPKDTGLAMNGVVSGLEYQIGSGTPLANIYNESFAPQFMDYCRSVFATESFKGFEAAKKYLESQEVDFTYGSTISLDKVAKAMEANPEVKATMLKLINDFMNREVDINSYDVDQFGNIKLGVAKDSSGKPVIVPKEKVYQSGSSIKSLANLSAISSFQSIQDARLVNRINTTYGGSPNFVPINLDEVLSSEDGDLYTIASKMFSNGLSLDVIRQELTNAYSNNFMVASFQEWYDNQASMEDLEASFDLLCGNTKAVQDLIKNTAGASSHPDIEQVIRSLQGRQSISSYIPPLSPNPKVPPVPEPRPARGLFQKLTGVVPTSRVAPIPSDARSRMRAGQQYEVPPELYWKMKNL